MTKLKRIRGGKKNARPTGTYFLFLYFHSSAHSPLLSPFYNCHDLYLKRTRITTRAVEADFWKAIWSVPFPSFTEKLFWRLSWLLRLKTLQILIHFSCIVIICFLTLGTIQSSLHPSLRRSSLRQVRLDLAQRGFKPGWSSSPSEGLWVYIVSVKAKCVPKMA